MVYSVHTLSFTKNQVGEPVYSWDQTLSPPPPHIGTQALQKRPRQPVPTKRHYERLGEEHFDIKFYILKYVQIYIWTHYFITKTIFEFKKRFRGTK